MMAMAKIAFLMLVVFKAAALENSHKIDSNQESYPYSSLSPSSLPCPPFPSAALAPSSSTYVYQQKQSESLCAIECAASCRGKKSFRKVICIGKCVAGCLIGHSDSRDDINCVIDCAQSSTNGLRYDAIMMDDRGSSCYQQCKRD